jgi:tetratricopeptide (TPR) repeat protein
VRPIPVIVWVLSVVVPAVLCFLPLFNLLGLESALVMGVVLGLGAMLVTDSALTAGLPTALPTPGRAFFALLPRNLALVLPGLVLLGANALRVRNCDPVQGLAFWLLIPVVSIAIGQGLVWGANLVTQRRALRLGLALGAVALDAAWMVWCLANEPSIMGHSLLLGWFPGSLYDEAIHVPTALKWYRFLCVGGLGIGILGTELRWRQRTGREVGPWLVGLVAVALPWVWIWIGREARGIGLDRADVAKALGGRVETEHFIIHYDPKVIDADGVALLVEDHEYRYAELAAWTGGDPVAWKGKKLGSYVYPTRTVQYKLMGSRRTLVARPWTHEMHIRWGQLGDNLLAHELAHLFSAEVGAGPLKLATRGGPLMVDIGMVEGFAYAADWPPSALTAHEATAAMRQLDMAPDLRAIFRPTGFWAQPSGKAYTMMGSFVRWLADTHGVDKLQGVYGSGDWEGVYGEPVEALIGAWEADIDTVALSEADLELARYRYSRGSIFQKVCARTVAELDRKAGAAESRRDYATALKLRDEIQGHQPGKPQHALALARIYDRMGDPAGALAMLDELLARPKLKAGLQAEIKELRGDIAWRAGRTDDALQDYADCLGTGVPDGRRRGLLVKQHVLSVDAVDDEPVGIEPLARRYMVQKNSSAVALLLALKWSSASPADPLPRYLVGLQLYRNNEYPDAIDALIGPPGLLHATDIDEQRRLIRGAALVRMGRFDEAEAEFDTLRDSENSAKVLLAAEYRDRIAFLRTWPEFKPWTPSAY